MSKDSGAVVVGFKYFFSVLMGIGRGPVNELVQIDVENRQAWPTPAMVGEEVPGYALSHVFPGISFTIAAPVLQGDGDYWVTFTCDTSLSFQPGKTVDITNLIREVPITPPDPPTAPMDLSGEYGIVARQEYAEITEPSFNIVPATITINIGSVAGDVLDWQNFVAYGIPPTFAPENDITLTVLPFATDPGAGGDILEGGEVVESGQIFINAPDLFGGTNAEGGVQGFARVMMGESTQVAPPELMALHAGEPQSGWRGRVCVFFDGLLGAMNPYFKPWKFRVRRTTEGWDGTVFYPEKATIILSRAANPGEIAASYDIHAMNPAHIIWECYTNRSWGRGLDASKLDEDSFTAAADTLYTEGFGLCLKWAQEDEIDAFIQTVLDHIGAAVVEDRSTTKIKLKLIRADYDPNTLPTFTTSTGLMEISDLASAATGALVNEVRVSFYDPVADENLSITVPNLANVQAAGGAKHSVTKNYPGLPTAALATRVGQRDARALGTELQRVTCKLDRRGWDVEPGSCIRLYEVTRGLRNTVFRVTGVKDGVATDGSITVTAVRDVFNLPSSSFVPIPAGGAIPPDQVPCVSRHQVFEMPYGMIVAQVSTADLNVLGEETGLFGVLADQGLSQNAAYKISVRNGFPESADYVEGDASYCGFFPTTYQLAFGDIDYETACYVNPFEAQIELLELYNAANSNGWIIASGYPTIDEALPATTRMSKTVGTGVTIDVWYVVDEGSGLPIGPAAGTYEGAFEGYAALFSTRTTILFPYTHDDYPGLTGWQFVEGESLYVEWFDIVEISEVTTGTTTIYSNLYRWTECEE